MEVITTGPIHPQADPRDTLIWPTTLDEDLVPDDHYDHGYLVILGHSEIIVRPTWTYLCPGGSTTATVTIARTTTHSKAITTATTRATTDRETSLL